MTVDTGLVALGALRVQAQQRADMLNSSFISVPEWNAMISSSYKALYDLLITSYGENYFVAPAYSFTQSGTATTFSLPSDFYKLLGVDLSNGSTWVTIRRFEFADRNKYQPGSAYSTQSGSNLRYKVMGSNVWFNLAPANGQAFRLWYIPKPANLQPVVACSTTSSSTTVTCPDTSQLTTGMSVADYAAAAGSTLSIPSGATITAIVANTSFTISAAATATTANLLAAAWADTYAFDGVSGWEEFIVLDVAVKALLKEESDASAVASLREDLRNRIIGSAPARDAGLAPTVTDAASLDSVWGDGFRGEW